jgi:hypothetical protein
MKYSVKRSRFMTTMGHGYDTRLSRFTRRSYFPVQGSDWAINETGSARAAMMMSFFIVATSGI